jgi:hypothetical protein
MSTTTKRMGQTARAIAIGASILILAPASVSALSLADLVAGGSIASADGSLIFDEFVVELPDVVGGRANSLAGLDLDIFQIETFERSFGLQVFEMDGPISALMGQAGQMVIGFRVLARGDALIESVALAFAGAAAGPGAIAGVTQTVRGPSAGATLYVGRASGGLQQPTDAVKLGSGQEMLRVRQDILVDSGQGFLAQISEVEQEFGVGAAPVPEPTAGALYLIGMMAMGAGTRLRARSA